MGSKATTTNFLFCPSFKYFFCLPHTQYAAKNPKASKSGVNRKKKSIFFAVPMSHTQMGLLSAKNAIEKVSCLGTFNMNS
jgi:hypothetical protein